ncbi:MAG: histidine phosphatase family protein [bacterium]
MSVSIVYETHSLTEDNEAALATGWLPGRLSVEGRRLAAELGARRRNDGLDAVFCSDLGRAAETARIAFEGSPIPVLHDWRLRECNYGDLNGCPVETLNRVRRDHVDMPFPNGQSYREVVELTRYFISDLMHAFDDKRVCVVGHSANKWAMDVLLLGKKLEDLVTAPFDWQEGWEYVVNRPATP